MHYRNINRHKKQTRYLARDETQYAKASLFLWPKSESKHVTFRGNDEMKFGVRSLSLGKKNYRDEGRHPMCTKFWFNIGRVPYGFDQIMRLFTYGQGILADIRKRSFCPAQYVYQTEKRMFADTRRRRERTEGRGVGSGG